MGKNIKNENNINFVVDFKSLEFWHLLSSRTVNVRIHLSQDKVKIVSISESFAVEKNRPRRGKSSNFVILPFRQ